MWSGHNNKRNAKACGGEGGHYFLTLCNKSAVSSDEAAPMPPKFIEYMTGTGGGRGMAGAAAVAPLLPLLLRWCGKVGISFGSHGIGGS